MKYLFLLLNILVPFLAAGSYKLFHNKVANLAKLLAALAAGVLLGDAFLHLLPESLENPNFHKYILGGFLVTFILESVLHWHHSHDNKVEANHEHHEHTNKALVINNLIADAAHNFLDGILIVSAFAASTEIGIATSIAILLHEIPQELGDVGLTLTAGYTLKRAVTLNIIGAISIIAGFLFGDTLSVSATSGLIAFSAGMFIYIAATDLMPLITKDDSKVKNKSTLSFAIGIIAMYLLTFFE